MNIKKKLMAMSLTGIVGLGLTVGGGTFALFTSSATNTGNTFTAGKLIMTAKRDDVPNVGPMFYTSTSPGAQGTLPTGLWAPGDKNTRGLFLKNDGSLQARLTTLTAKAADASGNVLTSGSNYDADVKFAQQAGVKIWQVQWFNPLGQIVPWLTLNSTQMDSIMEYVNQGYAAWAQAHPGADPATDPSIVDQIVEYVNQYLLDHINSITASGTYTDGTVKVTKLTNMKLSELINQSKDVKNFDIRTSPGESQLLAFTVELPRLTDNTYQGISANFNFGTDWVQTAHN